MDEPKVPTSANALARRLVNLRLRRRKSQARRRQGDGTSRQQLTKSERLEILEETGSRCHLCGGKIESKWQADHVLAHSSGGEHSVDNYLPAHGLCNNYRWHYSAEEFQWILKIGVWGRTQIERSTGIGTLIAAAFFKHERSRLRRRT